jgi:DNA-binding transcriptional LysR family regulator
VLNAAGKRLLAALNGATLSLEAILSELAADPFVGPVRISTIGVLTDYFVLPALLTLRERHPELQPCLEVQRTLDANERISSGRLDVAFYYEALTDERLEIERLGETTASVYCGRSHPLFAMEKVSLEALLEQPFSVPQFGDSGQVMDGWPVDQPRKIGMRITMLYTNLHVCLSGRFVTVLPDVVAAEYVERGQLRRLLAQPISPIPVYAARRRTDGENTVAASVVEAVRKVLLDEEKSA